jgi:8-oxo-dGTP pyrophosphatase MutT (NUDIX family)
MRYGISAAALIIHEQQVLLVNHRGADYDFWVPPGGKLEGTESIFDCARREAWEETGLEVHLDRIVYIQEFVEPEYHFCKFFILCRSFGGHLTTAHRVDDEHFLVDARFWVQHELQRIPVFPPILRTQFWHDLQHGFSETRYLGLEHVDP